MTPDAYILCTAPRSGSTLLCQMLRDTGVAGHPKSYFFERAGSWAERLGLPKDASLEQIMATAKQKGRGTGGPFGLRLQAHSLPDVEAALKTLVPEAAATAERIKSVFGHTRYLYLHRADKLAQAVSIVKAEQTGLWHRAQNGSEIERLAPPAPPVYDAQRITEEIATFTAYDTAWEAWFAANKVTPVRITYDALSADPMGTLAQVFAHLTLPPEALAKGAPKVAKLSDDISKAWIARYRAEQG